MLPVDNTKAEFIWVSIGVNGACSDAQIYNQSELCTVIMNRGIPFPGPEPLEGYPGNTLVGDDAFTLKLWLSKPFPCP